MAINVGKQVQSYVVGGVDSVLEWYDGKNDRTKTSEQWQTWGRVGGHLLGLAAQIWMPKYAALGETVAISTGPLVVKTLANAVGVLPYKAPTTPKKAGSREFTYVQRRMASPPVGIPAGAIVEETPSVPLPPRYE